MKLIGLTLIVLVAAGCASTRTYPGSRGFGGSRSFAREPRPLDEWMLEDAPPPADGRRADDIQYIEGLIVSAPPTTSGRVAGL